MGKFEYLVILLKTFKNNSKVLYGLCGFISKGSDTDLVFNGAWGAGGKKFLTPKL